MTGDRLCVEVVCEDEHSDELDELDWIELCEDMGWINLYMLW